MSTPGFVFYPAAVGLPPGATRLRAYPVMDTETAIVGIIIILLGAMARAAIRLVRGPAPPLSRNVRLRLRPACWISTALIRS
jgi:hypothetical protein